MFGDFYRWNDGNRVILLRLGGLPTLAEIQKNAAMFEARLRALGTGQNTLLPMLAIESGWPANTRVLTDPYSPSNLLNAQRN